MKRGRPPKEEPPERDASLTATALHRIRDVSRLPILHTPFGQLAFLGEFTQYQVDTAERIMQIYRDFHTQLGTRPHAASPSFEVGMGLSPIHEDDDERERAGRVKAEWRRLNDMLNSCRPSAVAALEELLIRQHCCPPGSLPAVKAILDALAIAYGYKLRKKPLTNQGPKGKSAASPTRY